MGAHVKTFMDFLQQYIENKGKYPVNKEDIVNFYNYNYIGYKSKITFIVNFNEKRINRILKTIRAREFTKDLTYNINNNNSYSNMKYEVDDNKNNQNEYHIYFNIKSYNNINSVKQFITDNKNLLLKYTVKINVNDNNLTDLVTTVNY